MSESPAQSLLLGRRLPTAVGAYQVEGLSFESSGYTDYAAHHATLGNAVLFRHERWPLQSPSGLEGLRRARRLQAELHHPRVVPVVDFFTVDGEWFSVFASIARALSLEDVIVSIRQGGRPPFSLSDFAAVSAGVTDGLAAIHKAGFVHRTLGTHNILLLDGEDVRLGDIGCATPIGVADDAAVAFRAMRPISAAPEQFETSGAFSPATDCWALGIALFELRYGRHPFWEETPSSLARLQAAILSGSPDFPQIGDDAAEAMLQPWLRRLLEPVPERRYADAMEAHRDLQAIVSEVEGQPPVARAFVAMPFTADFEPLWRALRAACASCRVAATRVDQSHHRDNVWDEVCDTIRSCDFTIAVASHGRRGHPNANVMLEVGYARGLQKPVLLLTDNADGLPFDLRTHRALVYSDRAVGGGELHRQFVEFIGGVASRSAPGG